MFRASPASAVLLLLIVVASTEAQRGDPDTPFQSGNIVVRRSQVPVTEEGKQRLLRQHSILRDQIDFGGCVDDPKYRRLPTTYYHPQGPVGLAFARFNWFKGGVNNYSADARLPASLVGLCASAGTVPLAPLDPLVGVWSEPPVAVIGMAAGTPASYARPFQHFHFWEPNKTVIELNERDKDCCFHYVRDARHRGADIQVFQGPPRETLKKEGPRGFYHLMIMEACSGENGEKIFLRLFTKEGIAQCLEHLAPDGVLAVHTSHRFVNLPPVLAAIAKDLKLHVQRGHDMAPGHRFGANQEVAEFGHYTSEWVLLSRKKATLDAICKPPANYEKLLKDFVRINGRVAQDYWSIPKPHDHVWTDKGPNLLHGILRGHPAVMRYSATMRPWTDRARELLTTFGLDSPGVRSFLFEASNMPRSLEDMLVQQQLKRNPQVQKLWP